MTEDESRREFLKKIGAGALGVGLLSVPAASKVTVGSSSITKDGSTLTSLFLEDADISANAPLTYSSGTIGINLDSSLAVDGSDNLSVTDTAKDSARTRTTELQIETRSSAPSSPSNGRIWIRTDV